MAYGLLVVLLTFFFLGVPIAFAMGLAALVMIVAADIPRIVIPQYMVGGADSFVLLAIPFFLLAGNLMNVGGITARLVDFARMLVGHITGGLAHVTIVAEMILSGITGSAIADASAEGTVLIPAMQRVGYGVGFAGAITAASATIGPIIPPSIPMVIFAAVANVSVGRLFLGGIVPGVLMGLYLMVFAYVIARRRKYPREPRIGLRQAGVVTIRAIPVLILPVIILGGILGGFFTPTEAAVVASAYTLVLGLLYRELDPRALPRIFVDTMRTSGVLMLIIAASAVLGWVIAWLQIPQALTNTFLQITNSPAMFLLIVNLLLLFLGCIMEPTPVIIILGPILLKVATSYGIDPIHFGLVFILNLSIGLITPPVGTVMYVVCALTGLSIDQFARHTWPFMVALVLVLLTVTYVPWTVMVIPNMMMDVSR